MLQFCKQPFEIVYLIVADYEEAFISCISRTNKEIYFYLFKKRATGKTRIKEHVFGGSG